MSGSQSYLFIDCKTVELDKDSDMEVTNGTGNEVKWKKSVQDTQLLSHGIRKYDREKST